MKSNTVEELQINSSSLSDSAWYENKKEIIMQVFSWFRNCRTNIKQNWPDDDVLVILVYDGRQSWGLRATDRNKTQFISLCFAEKFQISSLNSDQNHNLGILRETHNSIGMKFYHLLGATRSRVVSARGSRINRVTALGLHRPTFDYPLENLFDLTQRLWMRWFPTLGFPVTL